MSQPNKPPGSNRPQPTPNRPTTRSQTNQTSQQGQQAQPGQTPQQGQQNQPPQTPQRGRRGQPTQTPQQGQQNQPPQTPQRGRRGQPTQTPQQGQQNQPPQTPQRGRQGQQTQTPQQGPQFQTPQAQIIQSNIAHRTRQSLAPTTPATEEIVRTRPQPAIRDLTVLQQRLIHLDNESVVNDVLNFINHPRDDREVQQRLADVFQFTTQLDERLSAGIAALVAGIQEHTRLNTLVNQNERLISGILEMTKLGGRSRNAIKQATDSQKNTKEEIGGDYFDAYYANVPLEKTTWTTIRSLANWARYERIAFEEAHRMAMRQALSRLKVPTAGQTKIKWYTNADLMTMKKNWASLSTNQRDIERRQRAVPSDLPKDKKGNIEPQYWIDAYGVPHFEHPPPASTLNPKKPVTARPWDQTTEAGRPKRRLTAGPSSSVPAALPAPPAKKRRKGPHPSDTGTVPTGRLDPVQGGIEDLASKTPLPNTKSEQTQDGGFITSTRRGTPAKSLAVLSREWNMNDLPIIPITPAPGPPNQFWQDVFNNHTGVVPKLEHTLLLYYKEYWQWQANPGQAKLKQPPNPYERPPIRDASVAQVNAALLRIRRIADFASDPAINSYEDPENQSYWWGIGLVQWLAGQQLGLRINDPYRQTLAALLADLRNRFPDTTRDRVRLAPEIALARTDFAPRYWIRGGGEQHAGWVNDSIVLTALRYYARNQPGIQIIEPSALFAYIQQVRYSDRNALPPPINPDAHLVLVPININNLHWTLGVIDRRNRTITEIDSLTGANRRRSAVLFSLLAGNDIEPETFTHRDYENIVEQENMDDCGFWVIQNGRSIIESDTTAPQMPSGPLRMGVLSDLHRAALGYTPSLRVTNHIDDSMVLRRLYRKNMARLFLITERKPGDTSGATELAKQMGSLLDLDTIDTTIGEAMDYITRGLTAVERAGLRQSRQRATQQAAQQAAQQATQQAAQQGSRQNSQQGSRQNSQQGSRHNSQQGSRQNSPQVEWSLSPASHQNRPTHSRRVSSVSSALSPIPSRVVTPPGFSPMPNRPRSTTTIPPQVDPGRAARRTAYERIEREGDPPQTHENDPSANNPELERDFERALRIRGDFEGELRRRGIQVVRDAALEDDYQGDDYQDYDPNNPFIPYPD